MCHRLFLGCQLNDPRILLHKFVLVPEVPYRGNRIKLRNSVMKARNISCPSLKYTKPLQKKDIRYLLLGLYTVNLQCVEDSCLLKSMVKLP